MGVTTVSKSADTKEAILAAATACIAEVGFAGTTARAIAARGGVNQALIFYYFGDVDTLLLAALDRSSAQSLARYRAATAGRNLVEIAAAASDLYAEDLRSGHVTVVSEMIAGSLSRPHLRAEVAARVEPWLIFAEEIARTMVPKPFRRLLPARVVARATVAFFLGLNLLSHLDDDRERSREMLDVAARAMAALSPIKGRAVRKRSTEERPGAHTRTRPPSPSR